MDSKTSQELATVSQMLVQAGNQHAARLLSLAEQAEIGQSLPWEPAPVPVVLRVHPAFVGLFRPADLQVIAKQFDRVRKWGNGDNHQVSVAPVLADPFARNDLGSGTDAMQLRDEIAETLWQVSATKLPDVCRALGLDDGDVDEAMASKRAYVRSRTSDYTLDQLCQLGSRVVEQHYRPRLWGLLQVHAGRRTGVDSPFKNLIFAADGPKPELVLTDAVSNTIEISKNGEFCLVYDRGLDPSGLSWRQLVTWWTETHAEPGTSEQEAGRQLYLRLRRSLDRDRKPSDPPGPERQVFRAYGELLSDHGFDLPALIPQVYLHYDPYTRAQRREPGPLPRQRMDFLLLMRSRWRLVIECDGKQHYADDDGRASPRRYAEMVAADRELHLAGYEVVRFGGAEFQSQEQSLPMLRRYFIRLFIGHGYLPESAA
ncbi:hypothetical protein GA0070558_16021 [Micromonospora haikouensis]|uniref:AbiJ-NTD3 domain-containing protein n=1 Tax=Micromonospora haikouensis TaxID=686309 RepID=A0A1C4YP94_9ACTN|nr:hypothetical protein [Micromonospora haikouensis]SCF22583.1 hypothetical protein GA0070558_16021 [Micromonospora haikouensis]